jgi:hypothetical protein
MKRLDYTRPIRSAPGRARNAAEAVMVLASVARERHRLQQERRSLAKRMHRIDARLTAIAGTETRLVPTIQVPAPAREAPLPRGVTQVTLQY